MDNNRIILKVEEIPQVDLNFMNNTHFEEIEMVKILGELLSAYKKNSEPTQQQTDEISQKLKEWHKHTIAHFERENDLMRETSFPAYRIHSSEHYNALDGMESAVQAWSTDKDIERVSDYIFTQWPNWFNGHVNTMDMMTASYAISSGYSADDTPN